MWNNTSFTISKGGKPETTIYIEGCEVRDY